MSTQSAVCSAEADAVAALPFRHDGCLLTDLSRFQVSNMPLHVAAVGRLKLEISRRHLRLGGDARQPAIPVR